MKTNTTEFKIEKGIPIPSTGKYGPLKEAMKKMKVGDSVEVPYTRTLYQNARVAATKLGFKVTLRKERGASTFRLWRTAERRFPQS